MFRLIPRSRLNPNLDVFYRLSRQEDRIRHEEADNVTLGKTQFCTDSLLLYVNINGNSSTAVSCVPAGVGSDVSRFCAGPGLALK